MILLDTNVISEPLRPRPSQKVLAWLVEHDAELALSSVAIAEVAYGIEKIRPEQRAARLAEGLDEWRARFTDRIFSFTEDAALAYGELMGRAARAGRTRTVQDGMIAAIARVKGVAIATRNIADFEGLGIDLVDPWNN
ncbi:MAG: type II toxin-antitoxin system VapC family toxin [Thermoanaerobaculia bacterium]|nr:type II toxin-antitoxin system VapC family toxin [Thermoanaerobaculia bacterium]